MTGVPISAVKVNHPASKSRRIVSERRGICCRQRSSLNLSCRLLGGGARQETADFVFQRGALPVGGVQPDGWGRPAL